MGQMPARERGGRAQQSCDQESGKSFRPQSVTAVLTNTRHSEIVDRLNDWQSTIGKKAIIYFNEYIKKDEVLRRDPHEVALLVGSLLPYPAGKPDVFPLIYSHPKVCVSKDQAHHDHTNF